MSTKVHLFGRRRPLQDESGRCALTALLVRISRGPRKRTRSQEQERKKLARQSQCRRVQRQRASSFPCMLNNSGLSWSRRAVGFSLVATAFVMVF